MKYAGPSNTIQRLFTRGYIAMRFPALFFISFILYIFHRTKNKTHNVKTNIIHDIQYTLIPPCIITYKFYILYNNSEYAIMHKKTGNLFRLPVFHYIFSIHSVKLCTTCVGCTSYSVNFSTVVTPVWTRSVCMPAFTPAKMSVS